MRGWLGWYGLLIGALLVLGGLGGWLAGPAQGRGAADRAVSRGLAVPVQGTPTATGTPACPPGWQVVASPNVVSATNMLNAVAVVGPNDVWAVGSAGGD